MAGLAVVSLDEALAIGGFVFAVMAAETAGPVFMSNIVRVHLPTGFHFGEEVVVINPLHLGDG